MFENSEKGSIIMLDILIFSWSLPPFWNRDDNVNSIDTKRILANPRVAEKGSRIGRYETFIQMLAGNFKTSTSAAEVHCAKAFAREDLDQIYKDMTDTCFEKILLHHSVRVKAETQ